MSWIGADRSFSPSWKRPTQFSVSLSRGRLGCRGGEEVARGPVPAARVMGRAPAETAWTALQKPAVSSGKHLTASALESGGSSASKPTQQPRQLFVSHQEKKAKEKQVQRFLYTLWSSKKQPDVQSLVELLTAVRRCMPHRKRAAPLLLHCRYVTILLHPWAASQSWDPPGCTEPWHGHQQACTHHQEPQGIRVCWE